jgi:glycosyltransferase involved in cell wall biosynthesis
MMAQMLKLKNVFLISDKITRLITQRNKGQSSARNVGIRESKGGI